MSQSQFDFDALTDEQKKLLDAQLRKPEGEAGLQVAEAMDEGNPEVYHKLFKLIGKQRDCSVLELGFGTGLMLKQLISDSVNCTFRGLDYSELMCKKASELNKNSIDAGILELMQGSIDKMPFSNAMFDTIYTSNTIYFWDNPFEYLNEIIRVMKPGGVFANGMRSKDALETFPLAKHGFTHYNKDEVVKLFESAGLKILDSIHTNTDTSDILCVLAQKLK